MEPVPTSGTGEHRPSADPAEVPDRTLKPTVDELSEASFPASDPPPLWIWEPAVSP